MKINSDRIFTILVCILAVLFAIVVKLLPPFFYFQGNINFKRANYVKAHNFYKKAYNFDKNNTDYRYYYVQSLLHLSPSISVQKEIFEMSLSEKHDSAQLAASDKVSEWKNNVLQNIGNNYIEQVPLDNGILRWDTKTFPLKIFVLDQSETSVPKYYFNEIERAFLQWQTSTGFIKFSKTNKINEANIIVKILPLPNDVCDKEQCKYAVGFTTPNYKNKLLKNMTIVLYAKDPYNNFFSDKELYNTILHEIGHALGIMGHSYSSEDLMYMSSENSNSIYAKYRSSFQYLSSKDINTIKLLYKLMPTITNTPDINPKGLIYAPVILGTSKDISTRKLKEAQNYIKKAPDLASGYIDLSIAYAELGKERNAINAMEKALNLSKNNSEKYLCLYNLATLYLNISKYDKAEEYANSANNLSPNEDVKELLAKIKLEKIKNRK